MSNKETDGWTMVDIRCDEYDYKIAKLEAMKEHYKELRAIRRKHNIFRIWFSISLIIAFLIGLLITNN